MNMIPFVEKFHAQAIGRIIEAMKEDPEKSEHWASGADMSECFGWDGCGMSPITRVAFVNRYGEEITAKLEAEAKAEIESSQSFGANYRKHEAEAAETAKKPVSEWAVGDFVMALDCGLKFDHEDIHKHLWYFVEGEDMDAGRIKNSMWDFPEYRHVRPRLCKIMRIIEKPAGFFNDHNAMNGYKPLEREGGSASDDIPEDTPYVDIANLPKERRQAVYSTFYSLCVLMRTTDGEWVLIDAEGSDYARYVLIPEDYKTMFAPIIEGIRAKKEIERKEAEATAKAAHEKAKAEYDARSAKWAPIMKPLIVFAADDMSKDWKANEKIKKENVLAMARHAFPGVYFTLRKCHDWGSGWKLSWTNGPTEDEMTAATDFGLFCNRWDTFDSMTDCAGIEHATFTDFANRYGCVKNGIDFERTEAETDRNRIAKIEAAPAAVSLDGEVSVTENTEKNGIEIRFARKPSAEVLERIKSRRCWRWSRFSKCWYTRANETEREFAHALAAGTATDTARHEDVPGNIDAMLGY